MSVESQKLLSPHMLGRLQGLELRARTIVEGYVSGVHRSPFHGFSIEFAEHREYVPGDDLRYVDWKVFGKTDKVYLKQYEQETNLVCYLVVDASESMSYRSPDTPFSKLEYAQTAAAALAHLVLRQQDSVGVCTFDKDIRAFVRPSGNPSHLQSVLQVLEQSAAEKKTNSGPIFHDLAERFTKRGVVIILSDFFDQIGPMLSGLKHFRHRRHEVILMHVIDPAELEFPFQNTTLFKGLEEYPELLTDPRSLRTAYLEEFEKFRLAVQRGCREQGADYLLLRTDSPLDVVLSSFLAARMAYVR